LTLIFYYLSELGNKFVKLNIHDYNSRCGHCGFPWSAGKSGTSPPAMFSATIHLYDGTIRFSIKFWIWLMSILSQLKYFSLCGQWVHGEPGGWPSISAATDMFQEQSILEIVPFDSGWNSGSKSSLFSVNSSNIVYADSD
jgi:hypothetical protein